MKYPEEKEFTYFDDEEKELIKGIESVAESIQPLQKTEQEKIIKRFKNASERKSITLRIDQNDLEALRLLSEREGMPYQTLLGSIVHKYVTGKLVDVGEVKKILK